MTLRKCSLVLILVLAACGDGAIGELDGSEPGQEGSGLRLATENRTATIDVGSWNVEWFGLAGKGPADEPLQQANATKVLRETNLDVIGLVEIVSAEAFAQLVAGLPNHRGLLVTDARVEKGTQWYSTNEQKTALIFKRRFKVTSARVILTAAAKDFAGRPPLEVRLSFLEGGATRSMIVIVAHFKAMANKDGHTRRTRASAALKTYLETTHPTKSVIVVGDFNDDIDVSTFRGSVSPFQNFVDDADYQFTTAALTKANASTTAGFSATIDHHLVSKRLARRFVAGSAKVLHPEKAIPDFSKATSDHFPVLTRYDLRF